MQILNLHSPIFCKELLLNLMKSKDLIGYRQNYSFYFFKLPFEDISEFYIRLIWNKSKEYELWLTGFFGETIPQARVFYKKVNYSEILKIESVGWKSKPNLNLSYRGTKLQYLSSYNNQSYFEFWKNDGYNHIEQHDRETLFDLLSELDSKRFINFNAADKKVYEDNFLKTNRLAVNVNPDFCLEYMIKQNEFISLDKDHQLLDFIRNKIKECLGFVGNDYVFPNE